MPEASWTILSTQRPLACFRGMRQPMLGARKREMSHQRVLWLVLVHSIGFSMPEASQTN